MSVGRGTKRPFEIYGHPSFEENMMFNFTPVSTVGASSPKLEFKTCFGVDLANLGVERLTALRLDFLSKLTSFTELPTTYTSDSFFAKLAGNNYLQNQIKKGMTEIDIRKSWQPGLDV